MSEQDDYEAWFREHLPFVDRVIGSVSRLFGFKGTDADEFGWEVKERLWEHDYAVLRKWRGESRLTTYLTTVITNFGREFRVKRWGRWRPSAAAVRLGPLAVRLETLYYRDGLRVAEAGELLRTRGETQLTDRELAALLAQLPVRARARRPDEKQVDIETIAHGDRADGGVLEQEDDDQRDAAYRTLRDGIRRLDPEERIIIQMHFLKGLSLADVGRALGRDSKPLYRVKDRALARLRQHLRATGLTMDEVRPLLGGALDDVGEAPPENSADSRPSNEACDSNPEDDENGSSDSDRPGRSEP